MSRSIWLLPIESCEHHSFLLEWNKLSTLNPTRQTATWRLSLKEKVGHVAGYLLTSQHPVCHTVQTLPEGHITAVRQEVRGRMVVDGHIRARPHGYPRPVACLICWEPDRCRLIPPHWIASFANVEVLVADWVVHWAGQDPVRLCIESRHLEAGRQNDRSWTRLQFQTQKHVNSESRHRYGVNITHMETKMFPFCHGITGKNGIKITIDNHVYSSISKLSIYSTTKTQLQI